MSKETHLYVKRDLHTKVRGLLRVHIQPIAARVAQHLEIISKNLRSSTRRPGFSWDGIDHVLLSPNRKSHRQNAGLLKRVWK